MAQSPLLGPAGNREYTLEARAEDSTTLGDGTGSGNVETPATLGTDMSTADAVVTDSIGGLVINEILTTTRSLPPTTPHSRLCRR